MHIDPEFEEFYAKMASNVEAREEQFREDAPASGQSAIVMQLMGIGFTLGLLRTNLNAQTNVVLFIGLSQLVLLSLILWRVW